MQMVWINMTKSPRGPVWGDGTLYKETEAFHLTHSTFNNAGPNGDVYAIWNGRVDDAFRSNNGYFICQKNPFRF